jgi:hypothetical protein
VLGGTPLAEAERALAEGRVREAETGAVVRWEPAVAVYPISGRMRERLRGGPARTPAFPSLVLQR